MRDGCGRDCPCQASARASDRSRPIFSTGARYTVNEVSPGLFAYRYFVDPACGSGGIQIADIEQHPQEPAHQGEGDTPERSDNRNAQKRQYSPDLSDESALSGLLVRVRSVRRIVVSVSKVTRVPLATCALMASHA